MSSMVHAFDITLSDVDRGRYETLALQVAQHPSETSEYMVTRVLAYVLELQEGLAFSSGLSTPGEPAIWAHDLTGRLQTWIEVGKPDAARLHKASKAADRVVVYCHKDIEPYLRVLLGQKVHAPDRIEIVELDPALIADLAERVQRRTTVELSITEGQLYLTFNDHAYTSQLVRHPYPSRRPG